MPIVFIDNYPRNNLEAKICHSNGNPLYGEIWVYQELQKFVENGFVTNDTWYVKHNYNLSYHPGSDGKVEGQIDFLILNKYGVLVVEVKGGGVEVDVNDVYYSYDRKSGERYEAQNPFNQAKEYVHTLKMLIDTTPFIYRCIVFPHERNFELLGPQLSGYKHLFFSKRDLDEKQTDFARNELFYNFLMGLAKESRRVVIEQLNPTWLKAKVNEKIWEKFPELDSKAIKRLKSELFPIQTSYGFDPDRLKNEIILDENYEIMKGLRKNRKVMIQGAPGTGKTVLATKFLAENILKQQRGIFFCANKLLKAKMEYLMLEEHKLDPNLIEFKIYYPELRADSISEAIDFLIVDEAQEFFDKGLFDFDEALQQKLKSPKTLMLYDPEQTIARDFKEIDWYIDYFVGNGYVHYLFDTVWRGSQNPLIIDVAKWLNMSEYKKIMATPSLTLKVSSDIEKLKSIKDFLDSIKGLYSNYIVLVESMLLQAFSEFVEKYYKLQIEELTEVNINIPAQKLRFTTPIKYRGLEAENVLVITSGFSDKSKTQNFIGVTRAIYKLNFLVWS